MVYSNTTKLKGRRLRVWPLYAWYAVSYQEIIIIKNSCHNIGMNEME